MSIGNPLFPSINKGGEKKTLANPIDEDKLSGLAALTSIIMESSNPLTKQVLACHEVHFPLLLGVFRTSFGTHAHLLLDAT